MQSRFHWNKVLRFSEKITKLWNFLTIRYRILMKLSFRSILLSCVVFFVLAQIIWEMASSWLLNSSYCVSCCLSNNFVNSFLTTSVDHYHYYLLLTFTYHYFLLLTFTYHYYLLLTFAYGSECFLVWLMLAMTLNIGYFLLWKYIYRLKST